MKNAIKGLGLSLIISWPFMAMNAYKYFHEPKLPDSITMEYSAISNGQSYLATVPNILMGQKIIITNSTGAFVPRVEVMFR